MPCVQPGFRHVLGAAVADGAQRSTPRDSKDSPQPPPHDGWTSCPPHSRFPGSRVERSHCLFRRSHSGQCAIVGTLMIHLVLLGSLHVLGSFCSLGSLWLLGSLRVTQL